MGQDLIFNFVQILDNVWVPEPWLCSLDSNGRPLDLIKRVNQAQLEEWGLPPTPVHLPLLDLCAKLHHNALDAHFTRTEGRKKIGLTELYADKKIRPGIETYISRLVQKFMHLMVQQPHFMCLNAAQKPVLHHHTITIQSSPGQGILYLSKLTNTLDYRLQLFDPHGQLIKATTLKILTMSSPAWVVLSGNLFSITGISGKMIAPFQTKDTLSITQAHEKTWFHQFLKKNIDSDVQVVPEGFSLIEHNQLKGARISMVHHLFEQKILVKLHFIYPETWFENGDGQAIRTKILIPDDESTSVSIIKTVRNFTAENLIIQDLLNLGFESHDHLFLHPKFGHDLAGLVEFLISHRASIEKTQIDISLLHPDSDLPISTLPAKVDIKSSSHEDWFDIHLMIHIGPYQFPFKAFAGHIKAAKSEFILPDNTVFLIPSAWFTRYLEVAAHLLSQEENSDETLLRVHKIHTHLLETLEIITPKPTIIEMDPVEIKWNGDRLLKANLRPYQLHGVHFILRLWQNGQGACLADDMGLGKTVQTIAALAHFKNTLQPSPTFVSSFSETTQLSLFDDLPSEPKSVKLRALIVVPAALIYNWKAEVTHFCPSLTVYIHQGSARKADMPSLSADDICLTTYHTLREDYALLSAITWEFIVIDESQNIKNRDAEISKSVRQLKSKHRLALSGTPVENSLADLWSLFNFINPPLLGTFTVFQRHYLWPIERDGDTQTKTRLRDLITPFILRRRKQLVAPELPPLSRQALLINMSDEQANLYEKTKSGLRNKLLGLDQNSSFTFNALQALLRLRQMACHPALIGQCDINSGKMESVLEQYLLLREQGSKVLVFSSFEQHLLLYKKWLEDAGHPLAWISGQIDSSTRNREVARFQEDPEVQIFLITLRAGGTGLNLTAADYVFLLDPWWNPHAEEQAIARAHRLGQNKPVHVIRFITRDSIEEKILHLQAHKFNISSGLIDDELPPLTRQELQELFN